MTAHSAAALLYIDEAATVLAELVGLPQSITSVYGIVHALLHSSFQGKKHPFVCHLSILILYNNVFFVSCQDFVVGRLVDATRLERMGGIIGTRLSTTSGRDKQRNGWIQY